MARALVVIDMVKDFIYPEGALYCGEAGERIVPFIREKLDEFRANHEAIIFLCDRHEKDDTEFERFPPHCLAGTEGAELVEELRFSDYEDFITGKQRFNGGFNTDLLEQLEGIDEVVLTGVCTNICVLFTANELCDNDKKVTVYRRGVASFDEGAHEFALEQMKSVLGVNII